MLELVGLPTAIADKYPHEISGGAAASGYCPDDRSAAGCDYFDEATSALDVSIQQQILNLLVRLREETGISCIFISHDLAVVQQVSDRTAVMYKGEVVEVLESAQLTRASSHPIHET